MSHRFWVAGLLLSVACLAGCEKGGNSGEGSDLLHDDAALDVDLGASDLSSGADRAIADDLPAAEDLPSVDNGSNADDALMASSDLGQTDDLALPTDDLLPVGDLVSPDDLALPTDDLLSPDDLAAPDLLPEADLRPALPTAPNLTVTLFESALGPSGALAQGSDPSSTGESVSDNLTYSFSASGAASSNAFVFDTNVTVTDTINNAPVPLTTKGFALS